MWSLSKPIEVIRYLIVWRVNSSLVRTAQDFSADISRILGTVIADRLPTSKAADWHKNLQLWDDYVQAQKKQHRSKRGRRRRRRRDPEEPVVDQLRPIPDAPWPVESVILPYTTKRSNGKGDPIIWELKLFGEHAEHNFFLEFILPAIEEAGMTTSLDNDTAHSLWGHFDIDSVYVAQGQHWEPFIQAGQLDLNERPDPYQWAEGLTFDLDEIGRPDTLVWLTPFEWGKREVTSSRKRRGKKKSSSHTLPTVNDLIAALIERISRLYSLTGKTAIRPDEVWEMLHPEERVQVQETLDWLSVEAAEEKQTLQSVPKNWSGAWVGVQPFPEIPPKLLPYLELASILHIGKQTHFGYGTFSLR